MKLSFLLAVLVLVAGCEAPEHPSKATISNWNTSCFDGVLYYDLLNRLAPAYNRDGTLKLCGE